MVRLSRRTKKSVRISCATMVAVLCLWIGGGLLHAQPEGDGRVARVKAVFLYNFIDYVRWPEGERSGVFKVGILGDSPLERHLREIAKKRRAGDRKLQVMVFEDAGDLESCHILFISEAQQEALTVVRKDLAGKPVLIVSDTPGLARQGAAINFVLIEGKLKFEINQQALKRADLRASSQLLKLAILVGENGG